MSPINGLVFLRIIDNLKLLLNRCNTKQSSIQTGYHFLIVGFGVTIQIILDKVLFHCHDRFRSTSRRYLFDTSQQGLSCIDNILGAGRRLVLLNGLCLCCQQAFYILWRAQLLFQPAGAVVFFGIGDIETRVADKVGAVPSLECH